MEITRKIVAVVDDEADIRDLVALYLEKAGFRVETFSDGESFSSYLETAKPDLVILDLMLPDMDGLEICRSMRGKEEYREIPVIMLTARGAEAERILGLELGADDYITKPFSPREMTARAKAVLRRQPQESGSRVLTAGGRLTIDTDRHEVRVDGRRVDLTTTEFRILQLLAGKKGWVFSRDKILDFLWGREKAVVDRTVDVHIKHLREKLGEAADMIKNVRGVGYKLEE